MDTQNNAKNEIVVYQPNETVRLEVYVQDESVWLTQSQMAEMFGCTVRNIRMHLANIYACSELEECSTRKDFFLVRKEGARKVSRMVTCYNLDAIISVGYRVNSILGVKFRIWATSILKSYLLRGVVFNTRINQLEDKVDRHLARHDADIAELKDKVDFFVRTSQPPIQGVFYGGQVFDARVFATNHILSAKKSILLIDSWVDVTTLEILSKKANDVMVEIVASPRGNRLRSTDIELFNQQYGNLSVRTSTSFHDRFLIIDDERLYLIGASLKDLGRKCFAFASLDASEIIRLKERI